MMSAKANSADSSALEKTSQLRRKRSQSSAPAMSEKSGTKGVLIRAGCSELAARL
jgi:hypothetical protein